VVSRASGEGPQQRRAAGQPQGCGNVASPASAASNEEVARDGKDKRCGEDSGRRDQQLVTEDGNPRRDDSEAEKTASTAVSRGQTLRDRRGVGPRVDVPGVRSSGKRPAVLRESKFRPLPGAFPNRRTVIFFDWDDTLCPTTWIRQKLKDHMADSAEWVTSGHTELDDWLYQIPEWFKNQLPDEGEEADILEVQRAVIDVIKTAQKHGVVCIITNSVEGWVERTIKKWLPELKQYILGHGDRPKILVLYGQKEYKRPVPGSVASELPFVDQLGEQLSFKKAAMSAVLGRVDELYRIPGAGRDRERGLVGELPQVPWHADRDDKHVWNFLSIGDSDAEMKAMWLTAFQYQQNKFGRGRGRCSSAPPCGRLPHQPCVKVLKMMDEPTVDELVEQLTWLKQALPQVVERREHMELTHEDLRDIAMARERRHDLGPNPEGDDSVPDLRLHASDEVRHLTRQESV